MTPQEFIHKWQGHTLTERASAQSHFNDICKLIGHDDPITADKTGNEFAFEKGVSKTGGGDGFADVWKRGHFAWEYKKNKANLDKALEQLTRYASALENPPLHVACDTNKFKIVTAWTNTIPKTYEFQLSELSNPDNLKLLHALFFDPQKLRPQKTRASLTDDAAKKFIAITERLQHRHGDPEAVAHFVNQLVFCFFAEDVKLLPEDYFTKLLHTATKRPKDAKKMLDGLFAAMGKGGTHGIEDIAHFNGGLFDGRASLELDHGDIGLLAALGSMDWSLIDPIIFGTLFERFLDPGKRAQIGAHYTDETKIMMIVEPVIMRPLLAEWAEAKAQITSLMDGSVKPGKGKVSGKALKPLEAAEAERGLFLDRLRGIRILDPACGSGNFLYLALHAVKDIENRVILETEAMGLSNQARLVGPEILRGIELNRYAAELAQTTIWIGYIQWKIRNAIFASDDPVLRKLDNIECRDALVKRLIDADGNEIFVEAEWPEAEFIVGNPPFLGDRRMISELGEDYTMRMRDIYQDRIPGRSDLVCYWFAKAAQRIAGSSDIRVGLVATNSISGGNNLPSMQFLTEQSRIFEAFSDEEWTVDGAAVRVALICFQSIEGNDKRHLNGSPAIDISARLTDSAASEATKLIENEGVAFIGTQKNGPFDTDGTIARSWLSAPLNANGRPNSDVVRPWVNGSAIVRGYSDRWIIDFGTKRSEVDASYYEKEFSHVVENVKPTRVNLRRDWHRTKWWLHGDPRPSMRHALSGISRFICTPRVAKHRLFVWCQTIIQPDSATVAIARDDNTTFGILHSRFHEAWSLRLGTWLGVGNDPRYTPTTTFETFPFPQGLTPNTKAADYASDSRAMRISAAAKELDDKRRSWLNPPDLVDIVPEIVPTAAPGEEPVKYPDRVLPKNAEAALKLQERTLTKLYNLRPQWLASLHDALDRAVAAAYGWPEDISTDDALAKLLEINLERSSSV